MSTSVALKKFGLEQAFNYLYKDPEKNLVKLMDWADRFSKGEFEPQRRTIREVSLLDALRSPIFMAYHDGQPFNDNMMRPCPMLENPDKLREMVTMTGAKSTDMQSPETAEHLCAKCEHYAEHWTPYAEKLWIERKAEKKAAAIKSAKAG